VAATATPVLDLFRDLAAIPSPSGHERQVADRTLAFLRDLGLEPTEDDAGAAIGSNIGNIHVALPATGGEDGIPIFLNAHLDTVPPTGPIDPEVRNGVVVNRHDTILGADNKAAVAVMLAAVADLVQHGRPHAGVELVLTPMEEVGLRGAKAFDTSRLHARIGYCYDHAAPVGNVVLAAPTQRTVRFRFVGRAAHAGIAPEEGRSAIVAAARAVADMPLGRIDAATTANVGLIRGGSVRNAVPARATVEAEARSLDDVKLERVVSDLREHWEAAAAESGCTVEITSKREYRAYRIGEDDFRMRLAREGAALAGVPFKAISTGGGSDANTFSELGLPSVCLSAAMRQPHTRDEHVATADLAKLTDFLLGIVAAARRVTPP
jgi:tripeptide aminopeptidase